MKEKTFATGLAPVVQRLLHYVGLRLDKVGVAGVY